MLLPFRLGVGGRIGSGQQYFSTMAPVVIGNHVLVGTGNDLDMPGFPPILFVRDPEVIRQITLRTANQGDFDRETVHAIAQILDDAAQRIERL